MTNANDDPDSIDGLKREALLFRVRERPLPHLAVVTVAVVCEVVVGVRETGIPGADLPDAG